MEDEETSLFYLEQQPKLQNKKKVKVDDEDDEKLTKIEEAFINRSLNKKDDEAHVEKLMKKFYDDEEKEK